MGMYRIIITSDFSAAHMLRNYKGKCENLHGHNWRVEVSALSEKLNKQGMVFDFKDLKEKVNTILDKVDHKNLNKIAYFKKTNPTSENIAKFIYDKIKSREIKVKSVTVWESDTARATYEV